MRKILQIIILFTNFCYCQNDVVCDSISYFDINFNGNSLNTKFENIKKYIDITKTKATVSLGNENGVPFTPFKENEIVYTIQSDFFNYNYSENNSDSVYITKIKLSNNINIFINYKNIKLSNKTKICDLRKYFPNTKIEKENEFPLKFLVFNGIREAFLCFKFKKERLVYAYLFDKKILIDN